MPPEPSSYDLRDTIAERWRAELMGAGTRPRSHWTTKIAYYRAACEALAAAQDGVPNWRDVVETVRPHGSISTFYEVAGRSARHGLIDAYHHTGDGISLQIAYEYHRTKAIDYLIDEAKVWSYWEYREAYLRTHLEADLSTAGYKETLAAWASVNRPVAAALDFAPPVCAVEDLIALYRGGIAPLRARQRLTAVMREAVRRPDLPMTGPSDIPARAPAPEFSRRLPAQRGPADGRPAPDVDEAAGPTRPQATLPA